MRLMKFPLAAAAAAAVLLASGAQAANFNKIMLSDKDVYRNSRAAGWHHRELLHLQPNGTLTGSWMHVRHAGGVRVERSGSVRGQWSVKNGDLCLQGHGLSHKGNACFELTKAGADDVEEYKATGPNGRTWQFFIETPGIHAGMNQ
jgi:hypothetical protein